MKKLLSALLPGLFLVLASAPACAADAQKQTAQDLAAQMRQARLSEGFSARMNVAVIQKNGRRLMPFKVAVIGQMRADRQRLLVRGISPEMVKNRQFAAERNPDGGIRAIAHDGQAAGDSITPQTRLFDSGMVLWDMLAPWWNWPGQSLTGTEQIGGQSCMLIESLPPRGDAAISKVVSCVARDTGLALRTQIFDAKRKLIRTLTVAGTMRKASGAMAAKRLTITEADDSRTEIEVYSGDENYQIGAETFSMLDTLFANPEPK